MKFRDKRNRLITLKYNDVTNTISAYQDDNHIGQIDFLVSETDDKQIAYPYTANITKQYQHSGIATEIIKYATTIYDIVQFERDYGYGGKTNYIHYSEEGLALKNSCERNGITKELPDDDE